MTDTAVATLAEEAWAQLIGAPSGYTAAASEHYDEVLDEVAHRVATTGSIGKADIGALLFWKRLRANSPWVTALHAMPDEQVRGVTAPAVHAVNDLGLTVPEAARRGRAALSALPGFKNGDALASALLTAAAPDRMAVYDRRARAGLKHLGIELSDARGRYARYMAVLDDLATQARARQQDWTARDVDLALYWLGRS